MLSIKRQMEDFGIKPSIGLIIGSVLFGMLSHLVFLKTEYAPLILIAISSSMILNKSTTRKEAMMRQIYSSSTYLQIMTVENCIIAIPFIITLLLHQYLIYAALLFLISIALSLVPKIQFGNKAIQSPYYHWPYEFSIGFRRTYILLFFLLIIFCIGLYVENYNLSLVIILIIQLIFMSYYIEADEHYAIWLHKPCAKKFLSKKILIALWYSFASTFLLVILLLISNPNDYILILGLYLLSFIFLVSIILMRYACYPRAINIPEIIIMILAVIFPPLLLIIIPFYIQKSLDKIKLILLC